MSAVSSNLEQPEVFLWNDLVPKVRIQLKKKGRGWLQTECVLDTGYWGGVALPRKYSGELAKVSLGVNRFVLADGSQKFLEVFRIKIKFQAQEQSLPAVFVEQRDGLLGLEFLKEKSLLLDLKGKMISLVG